MPLTKSAKKALRKSLKKREINRQKKAKIKKLIKKFKNLIFQKKIEEAKKMLSEIYKILDKADKTGLIKKNTANRKKSRLTLFLQKQIKSNEKSKFHQN